MIIDQLILKLDSIIKDPVSLQLSALPSLEFLLFFSGLSLYKDCHIFNLDIHTLCCSKSGRTTGPFLGPSLRLRRTF